MRFKSGAKYLNEFYSNKPVTEASIREKYMKNPALLHYEEAKDMARSFGDEVREATAIDRELAMLE